LVHARQASTLTKNIADSEVLNAVSQIVLKIDFVFVIGTTIFNLVHARCPFERLSSDGRGPA
jgi:hypothetical protein